ncbi:MAG: Hsp20/alpha crystallin family protein [Prochlorococcaceae cyanobacterium]
MELTKWEPLREIEDFFDRYSRSLAMPFSRSGSDIFANGGWAPRVDVSENDDAFVIKAEIPGIDKDDVKVSLENGVLTLQGERRQEREEKGWRYHRMERSYGHFMRSFTLPSNVDEAHLKASFHNGLLEVDLPKIEQSPAQALQVPVEG